MSASPRRVAERGELRRRIVEEATQLFAEKGFSGTSIRQLVAACGCTKPALYYYFDSKETLFLEVVRMHMDRTSEMLEQTLTRPGSVRQRMRESVQSFIDYARAEPMTMRLLQRVETRAEEGAPEVSCMATRELHLGLLSTLIQQGIEDGQLRADVPPDECALVLAGAISFQFEMALATGEWDVARILRSLDLIFDGISR